MLAACLPQVQPLFSLVRIQTSDQTTPLISLPTMYNLKFLLGLCVLLLKLIFSHTLSTLLNLGCNEPSDCCIRLAMYRSALNRFENKTNLKRTARQSIDINCMHLFIFKFTNWAKEDLGIRRAQALAMAKPFSFSFLIGVHSTCQIQLPTS